MATYMPYVEAWKRECAEMEPTWHTWKRGLRPSSKHEKVADRFGEHRWLLTDRCIRAVGGRSRRTITRAQGDAGEDPEERGVKGSSRGSPLACLSRKAGQTWHHAATSASLPQWNAEGVAFLSLRP